MTSCFVQAIVLIENDRKLRKSTHIYFWEAGMFCYFCLIKDLTFRANWLSKLMLINSLINQLIVSALSVRMHSCWCCSFACCLSLHLTISLSLSLSLETHMQDVHSCRYIHTHTHTCRQLVLLVSPSVQDLRESPAGPDWAEPLEVEELKNIIKCRRADMTAGPFEGLLKKNLASSPC